MSVQFGRWNTNGRPVDQDYLAQAGTMLAPYGPDGEGAYIKDNVGIVFFAFHTTKESRKERQPYLTRSGAVLTWDGRLDNRTELVAELSEAESAGASDAAIVAAAYETRGTACFAKLIGDWALSIWEPMSRSLILAKDPIGTRHLYYSFGKEQVTWSSILDPLVLLAGGRFTLEEEYIAGWLSLFPATHLTPYVEIHSVPPCCFVLLGPERCAVREYWNFDPDKRIRHRGDGEYEEHFRSVFAKSVRRRLRADRPIAAELSGGVDSSSVVCMADKLIAEGAAEASSLFTISYYNDSEPNWSERPYFTRVEEQRGRVGCHVHVGATDCFAFEDYGGLAASPASARKRAGPARQFAGFLQSIGARCLLCGIGGDEVLGGVPTPGPELEDSLATARLRELSRQLRAWALAKRKPWPHLLFQAMQAFCPPGFFGMPRHKRPAPWLRPSFLKQNRAALRAYEGRLKLWGPLPTFQENIAALNALRRQLACEAISPDPLYEKRYPYLDRDLLEFLYAVPREQLVRPGQRRSLMRRALTGIVPGELLNRRRKAFVSRGPMVAIGQEWSVLEDMSRHMIAGALDIVDPKRFLEILEKAKTGQEIPLVPLLRTLSIELWLRNVTRHRILAETRGSPRHAAQDCELAKLSAEKS